MNPIDLDRFLGVKLRINNQIGRRKWRTFTYVILDTTTDGDKITFNTTKHSFTFIAPKNQLQMTIEGMLSLVNGNLLFARVSRRGELVSNKLAGVFVMRTRNG